MSDWSASTTTSLSPPGTSNPLSSQTFQSRITPYSSLITHLLLALLILLYFTFSAAYAGQRYLAIETGAYDTGSHMQPLWNFINGNNFAVTIMEDNGPLRWATHVEPILFLVAPLYAIWPDPRTLYWLQAAAISLSAIPLFALGVRRLQNRWAALAVVLAYFLMPATQSVTLFDYHSVSLAPLFLLSAIYFLDHALSTQNKSFWLWPEASRVAELQSRRVAGAQESRGARRQGGREDSLFITPHSSLITHHSSLIIHHSSFNYALSGLFFLLALSTKEDISLHVFMIGAYLLFLRRRWQEGSILMGVGLVWFYVTSQVIIPAFRTAGGQSIYLAWFETLGNTPMEIILSPIFAPDKVLALIFRPDTLPPLAMITVPMALLSLAGLPILVMAAPSMAFVLLSQNLTLRQLETWHYAAPMLAFIALATVDGMARITHYASRNSKLKTQNSKLILTIFTLILLASSLTYHYFRGYTPLAQLYRWPQETAHGRLGREIAATIPPEASVLAQAELVPYVAHRRQVGIWHGPLNTDYDYIFFDLSHPKLPNRFNAHGDLLIGLIIEPNFGIITMTDGYMLLKNGAKRDVISDDLFTFTQFDQLPAAARPFSTTFDDTLKLVGVESDIRRLATSETEPQVVLYFETLNKPDQDYHLFLYLLDENGAIIGATDYPQPGIFWWPTSRWEAGDKRQIRVNTIPWWTGDKRIFGYALGLSRTDDPWDVSARLPVTLTDPARNPPGSRPIEENTLLPIAAFRRFAGLVYPKPLTIIKTQ